MYGVSYGRLPLFKVCGGASPSCRRNPLALGRGGSQVAQLVECLSEEQKVIGSIPILSTNFADVV